MNQDPHDRIRRLAAAVQARRALPDDLAAWLGDGLQSWIDSGGRGSLDRALGLKGKGVRSLETRDAKRRRDAALAIAAEFSHDGQSRPVDWRARYLAQAIQRFEARTWPRVRDHDHPPQRFGRLDRALFYARAANGRPLPTTAKYLRARILGSRK